MLRSCFIILFSHIFISGSAQAIDSVQLYTSTYRSSVEAITQDKFGNQYVAGYFKDTVFLRNKYPVRILNQAEAMYINSFSPTGVLRFSKVIVTNEKEHIKMVTDDSGNVFIGTQF